MPMSITVIIHYVSQLAVIVEHQLNISMVLTYIIFYYIIIFNISARTIIVFLTHTACVCVCNSYNYNTCLPTSDPVSYKTELNKKKKNRENSIHR